MDPQTTTKMIRRPRPGTKAEAILTLAATTPATPPQIASAVKTSRQRVHQVLEQYGLEANTLETFKECRADLLALAQSKDLETYLTLDPEARKKLIERRGLVDLGILYDKERLERGGTPDESRPLVLVVRGDNARIQVNQAAGSRNPAGPGLGNAPGPLPSQIGHARDDSQAVDMIAE